jgi:hypothetical protein
VPKKLIMKTTFFIFWLTMFSLSGQAQTNVYYPFPTSATSWREWFGGVYCPYCSDYQDFIIGDTIIAGRNYHKIRRTGVHYYVGYDGFCTNIIWSHWTYYNGAYRNDSINKKVYYVPPSTTIDTLLYDFNLNLHDTLPQSYLYDSSTTEILFVDEIDSILIGSKYHKEYRVTDDSLPPSSYFYLIEGIGSSFGLLAHLHGGAECGDYLLCVLQNGLTIYPDSTYSCQLVEGVPEIKNLVFTFKIFPNPVSGIAVANFTPPLSNLDLSITNVFGIELIRIQGLNDGKRIDLTNFRSGLYLYKVIQGTSIISNGKLIKIE